MSGTRHRCMLVVGAVLALVLAPSTAQAAEVRSPGASVSHAVETVGVNSVEEYWTPERMASAIPVKASGGLSRGAAAKTRTPAPEEPVGPPTTGAEPVTGTAEGSGDIGAAVTATQVVGKVFFTGSDGLNYVCSGSAVNSANKNMVFTAGHCVHGGPGKSWSTNWQFVPGYSYGSRPYGTWSAETLISFNGWTGNGNFGYDVGIAIMAPNSSGTELVNAVGGLGIQWNQSKSRFMTAMGYPASGSFDGQQQRYCQANTSQLSLFVTDQIKMACNMTGGSSGGPWIYGKDDNVYYSGYVNGVNSNVNNGTSPTEMRSPYFATWVGDAYNKYSAY
ncbi:peptidase [Streptomyces thermolineatus]